MASFSMTSAKGGSSCRGGAWAQAKLAEDGGGGGILGKIKAIEKEMSITQKNKATSSHLGSLKAKLCQLRRELCEPTSAGGGKQPGFEVQRMGDCRVGIVGFPSVGKSSLLSALTGVRSEVGAYDFTTLTCIPGVIYMEDTRIQLLDLPGIIVGASTGKGRGRQVIATAKSCDMILMALDATKEEAQKEWLTKELDVIGIRLNRRPPDIYFARTKGGGLKFNSTVPLTSFDRESCESVLKQYKIFNADVVCHEDVTVDDFVDVIDGNRKYCKCLYVYNKIDMLNVAEIEALAIQPHTVVISVMEKLNLDYLLKRMWDEMQVVRVYTKKKGQFPDFKDAVVITAQRGNKQFTVENAVGLIHKSLIDEFKHALVWGRSVKQSPTQCGLKHILEDEDVMQIVKMTQAERVRKLEGKKTGQTIAGSNTKVDAKK